MTEINPEDVPEYQEELTPDEETELLNYISSGSYPKMQEQNTLVGFFNRVLKTKDTTKAGFLTEGELAAVRTLKSTYEYAKEMGLNEVAIYINQISENTLATSLSRDAKLLNTIVTSKKQLSTQSGTTGEKKAKWFGKKE